MAEKILNAPPTIQQPIGFVYKENFLTINEQDDLFEFINNQFWDDSTLSRRTQHYGFRYNYKFARNKQNEETTPCPDYLKNLFLKINSDYDLIVAKKNENFLSKLQIIVNEYKPKQGISWHIDDTNQFGDFVACISIGCDCLLELKKGNLYHAQNIHKGSLYILKEDSRYNWAHSLKNNTNNNTRISITFRIMKN